MNGSFVGPQQGCTHPAFAAALVQTERGTEWACPGGYHKSFKSKYSDGFTPVCVKNRHMNFLNIRAARRSIRRLRGAERTFRQIMHFVSPKKAKGSMRLKGCCKKKKR